jgi:hypothetical protein
MIHDGLHCHTCDIPVGDWDEFTRHASAGHVVMRGRAEGQR